MYLVCGEALFDFFAQIVRGKPGKQPGFYAQSTQAHGHVEGRTTGNRIKADFIRQAGRVRLGKQIK